MYTKEEKKKERENSVKFVGSLPIAKDVYLEDIDKALREKINTKLSQYFNHGQLTTPLNLGEAETLDVLWLIAEEVSGRFEDDRISPRLVYQYIIEGANENSHTTKELGSVSLQYLESLLTNEVRIIELNRHLARR